VEPVALTVDYARQTCSALAEGRAAGIIHCDVKPSNPVRGASEASNHSRIKRTGGRVPTPDLQLVVEHVDAAPLA
jgi:serine/threonine protein kinase